MNVLQKDPQDEIEIILRHSHHPNIVTCRDVKLNKNNINSIFELFFM